MTAGVETNYLAGGALPNDPRCVTCGGEVKTEADGALYHANWPDGDEWDHPAQLP